MASIMKFPEKPPLFVDVDQPVDVLLALNELSKNPNHFILLAGQSGRGKTYAAEACLKAAQKRGLDTGSLNVPELNSLWVKDRAQMDQIIHYPLRSNLLLLDDIGFRAPSDSFLDELYVIINSRLERGQGTIFTTNLTSSQMPAILGTALTSRICSGKVFRIEGENRRLKPNF